MIKSLRDEGINYWGFHGRTDLSVHRRIDAMVHRSTGAPAQRGKDIFQRQITSEGEFISRGIIADTNASGKESLFKVYYRLHIKK